MSKYELAVVVNAQIDDEARTAVLDNCKALVEKFGGTITNVDDWGKILHLHSVRCRGFRYRRDRAAYAHYGQCHQISVR